MDIFTSNVNISYPNESEHLKVEDSVKAIGVKIEAARSGRINGNFCFYTPKAMIQGVETFTKPFPKHLRDEHNGDALGPVTEAEYVTEFFPKASKEFLEIVKRVNKYSDESNGKELVKAVKELIQTPEYRDESYRGLGIANIYGDIWDRKAIHDIKTRDRNKGTVSIGGKSVQKEVYCSICGESYHDNHEHKKGIYYNDEMCFHIHNDLTIDHCGFVTVPADKLTNTEVVKDSQQDNLSVDITYFKTEKFMLIEQLKEAVKDASAVRDLIKQKVPDEALQAKAFESYEASIKNSRDNHFLFGSEKLLNLRTVFGIAVAEDLVSKMADDDENKPYLVQTIERAKSVLNIEDVQKSLEEALKPKEEPKTEDPKEGEPEDKGDTPPTPEQPSAKVEDMQQFFEEFKKYVDSKFESLEQKTTKVQDSESATVLTQELKTLRNALDADEVVINNLQENYKNTLIELVKARKGTVSEEYLAQLKNRTVEELKVTLQDLEEFLRTKQDDTTADKTLEPASKEDAIKKVEDSQKDIPEDVKEKGSEEQPAKEEGEPTAKVEDSQNDLNDNEADIQTLIKRYGLVKALDIVNRRG